MATGVAPESYSPANGECPGASIGRYRLLEQIGEGGFGTVWLAEQKDPVRRQVALKTIKHGMDTHQVVARFDAERQALALMDHPNIARVFDGGATESGRPYFVMELVRGVQVTRYCDDHKFTVRQRIELFIQVCHAVQHAHQKGIIHRDLKPSNILIAERDGRPVPKVIDFGVAKAIEEPISDPAFATRTYQFIGTPSYMSPEQAGLGALDVDTRSDIYSLGVLLYELITGQTPLNLPQLANAGPEVMLHTIREIDPPRPSTRLGALTLAELTTTADFRSEEPQRLRMLVSRDLDWIALKALAKDRTRRYATANGLAADLQRYLDGDVVTAVPPSLAYCFQKFARKNRSALVSGMAAGLLLCAATAMSFWEARQATRQAEVAEQHRRESEASQHRLRQAVYAADMNLVGQALMVNNLERARNLVERHRPRGAEQDLRGWEWYFFESEMKDRSAFSLPSRQRLFERISLSPDGSTLALPGLRTNMVELWDMGQQRVKQQIPLDAFWLKYSMTGRYLATARFGQFALWDLLRNEVLQEWPRGYLCDASFSSDDTLLAAITFPMEGDRRASLELWSLPDGKQLAVRDLGLRGRAQAFAVAMAPGARTLVISLSQGDLIFFRLPDLIEERRLQVHDDRIIGLAFSSDGRWLAAGSGFSDTVVRLWDLNDGMRLYSLRGHAGWVRSVTFSRDGRLLASASSDQSARIWDVRTKSLLHVLRGHQSQLFSVDFSPDSEFLITGAKLGEAKIWRLRDQRNAGNRRTLPILNELSLSRDHKWFAGFNREGAILFGKTEDPEQATILSEASTNYFRLGLSPNSQRMVLGDRQGGIAIHSCDSGLQWQAPMVHRHAIRTLGFLDREEIVNTIDESGLVVAWTSQLRLLRPWQLPPECSRNYLATDYHLGLLIIDVPGENRRVYNLRDGSLMATLSKGGIGATSAASTSDGSIVAISDDDGTVELWEIPAWRQKARLRGHVAAVGSVAFSPDGKRLITGSNGSEAVRFWDTETFQQICDLPVVSPYNMFLSFSADGRSLAYSTGSSLQLLQINE